ncbi:MAG: S8 family serine peptidase [Bacteroidales bacterium]|nr:S8 family serine peptidase [Bacteroidales bacterium]
MKKLFFITCLLISYNFIFSQTELAPNKFLIRFTDKNNCGYSISRPEKFLSQRAIDRRQKQNIIIDNYDLPVNSEYILKVKNTGVKILNKSKWFNSVVIETSNLDTLNKIMNFSFVKNDEFKPITKIKKQNKSFFDNEFYKGALSTSCVKATNDEHYNYGLANNQIEMINGKDLHDKNYRGQGMNIAIIDAGFINTENLKVFDSLWHNNQILGEHNFVEKDSTVFARHTHGTMVLSTIGGNIPGKFIGTAPKANFWLLLSEDANSEYLIEEYNWASAAEFADSVGADIINSSLAYSIFNAPSQNHNYSDMDGKTTPVTQAANIAASKGIIIVNSAGNEGNNSWKYICAPADADKILCVGAVDSAGNYASFSSIGPTYDGRTKPDIVAQGKNAAVANAYGGYWTNANGTSFSSPIIAGMCACLWQAHPLFSNMEIIDAIIKSADNYQFPDNFLGYGIPDFSAADKYLSEIEKNMKKDFCVNIFPNPFIDIINMTLYSFKNQKAVLSVFDITGRKVFLHRNINLNFGYNKLSVNALKNIAKGFYFVKISTENNTIVEKIIKCNAND